jgi:hypothetical protein
LCAGARLLSECIKNGAADWQGSPGVKTPHFMAIFGTTEVVRCYKAANIRLFRHRFL